jgi:hypothetical protein
MISKQLISKKLNHDEIGADNDVSIPFLYINLFMILFYLYFTSKHIRYLDSITRSLDITLDISKSPY